MPSEIKDLNLNDVVNKWSQEVSELSAQFEKAASMVARWDRAIIQNEDRVRTLHRDSESLEVAHKELSENLDTITAQQSELHGLLDELEKDVEKKLGTLTSDPANGQHQSALRADREREDMHRMSVEVMSDLDAMAQTIRDLVLELNKKTGGDDGVSDSVSQIISVLNSHLDSLQYLDESSSQLAKRVNDVTQQCEAVARETSRFQGRRHAGMY